MYGDYILKKVIKIVLGIIVLLLIMTMLGSSGDNTSNQAQATIINQATSDQKNESNPNVYKIGDRVVIGDMVYTVTNFRKAGSAGDQYANAKANGIYVIVDMTIENLGNESTTISPGYAKIINSQGKTFESDPTGWVYLQDNILLKQIQPGLPVMGQAIFDVPEGITYNLQVTDSVLGSNTALISLGAV
jgi:hypothetical protein